MRGGDAHVAGECQLHRAGTDEAVDAGNDHLRQRLDGVEHLVGEKDEAQDLFLGETAAQSRIEHAGGENLRPLPADDDRMDIAAVAKIFGDRREAAEHRLGQPVLLLGLVENDFGDGAIDVEAHAAAGGGFHPCPSRACSGTRIPPVRKMSREEGSSSPLVTAASRRPG